MAKSLPLKMKAGQILLGPDFYGCINTGIAPAILHSRILKEYPRLNRGYRFVVGEQMYVEQAAKDLLFDRVPKTQAYIEYEDGRRSAKFFRTYKAAKNHFLFLSAEAEKRNKKIRAEHESTKARAAKGDMQAVADLIDY